MAVLYIKKTLLFRIQIHLFISYFVLRSCFVSYYPVVMDIYPCVQNLFEEITQENVLYEDANVHISMTLNFPYIEHYI